MFQASAICIKNERLSVEIRALRKKQFGMEPEKTKLFRLRCSDGVLFVNKLYFGLVFNFLGGFQTNPVVKNIAVLPNHSVSEVKMLMRELLNSQTEITNKIKKEGDLHFGLQTRLRDANFNGDNDINQTETKESVHMTTVFPSIKLHDKLFETKRTQEEEDNDSTVSKESKAANTRNF